MTSTEPVWMTPQALSRLQTELAALRRSGPSIEVPDDYMDYDDNLVARHAARQARIRQIQDLLTNAVVGEDPPDDGIAEPGMVLTVRYDDTGEMRHRGVLDAIAAGPCDRRSTPRRTAHLLHPQWGQPARDPTQGGALRGAPTETAAATVCPTAPQWRPPATRGHANRPRPDHPARTDDLACARSAT